MHSFNSLSRDHTDPEDIRRLRRYPILSTPSLGITGSLFSNGRATGGRKNDLSTPSLGITEQSRDIGDTVVVKSFQLPLSGSRRSQALRDGPLPQPGLSTPSLGITTAGEEPRGTARQVDRFQLPLSGSRGFTFLLTRAMTDELSTPSLGITDLQRC